MTPALGFFLAWLVLFAAVDLAFQLGWLPSGTVSQGISDLARRHPLGWHLGYVALAAYGYWHFFGD